MLYAVLTGLLILAVYFPRLWIKYTLMKHSDNIADMPGTGGELAVHLIKQFALKDVVVEKTQEGGDHFDPKARAVRLSPSIHDGKSLTAVAVAAHEVGHAIQCYRGEKVFELRSKYLPTAMQLKKIGIFIIAIAPFAGVLFRSPGAFGIIIATSLVLQLLGALAYLIVLPEEWDASFNKALPMLVDGEYIYPQHVAPIRQVLKAAALTYFASALADVLNIGRWLLVLRR